MTTVPMHVYVGPVVFLGLGVLFIISLLLHPRRISVIAFLPLLAIVLALQLLLNWLHPFVGDAVTTVLVIVFVAGAVITARRRRPR